MCLNDFGDTHRVAHCCSGLQISDAGIVLDWLDCASWMDGVEQRLGKVPTREPLQRLMAGGIAGAFSRTGDTAQCSFQTLPAHAQMCTQ